MPQSDDFWHDHGLPGCRHIDGVAFFDIVGAYHRGITGDLPQEI